MDLVVLKFKFNFKLVNDIFNKNLCFIMKWFYTSGKYTIRYNSYNYI